MLYPFQEVGIRFLYSLNRAILADEQGLGKTIQLINTCQMRYEEENKRQLILVICPYTFKYGWKDEINKWANNHSITVIHGSTEEKLQQIINYIGSANEKKQYYLICNFELFSMLAPITDAERKKLTNQRNELLSVLLELMKAYTWDTVIVDECQNLVNYDSKMWLGTNLSIKSSRNIYLASGTPIQNKTQDLFPLLRILFPKEYTSRWAFCERFCNIWKSPWGKQVLDIKDPNHPKVIALRQELSKFLIRRTKEEVLTELPPKIIKHLWLELEGKQLKQYQQLEDEMYLELKEKTLYVNLTVAQITYLKQLAISPSLLDASLPLSGTKVEAAIEYINSIDSPIVIFSQYKKFIYQFMEQLQKIKKINSRGIECITGDTDAEVRSTIVKRFQNKEFDIFLGTTKACQVALTLTAAQDALFLDRFWNPHINIQAQDRLHRISQRGNVTITNLLCYNTVDEDIEATIERKMEIFNAIFPNKEYSTLPEDSDTASIRMITDNFLSRRNRNREA